MANDELYNLTVYAQDKMLTQHGRHSYEVFEKANSSNKDLSKLLLNNCCVRHWQFNNCNIDNSDFQGTEFENCEFINTSFNGADITSCSFKNCIFINCKFLATNLIDTNIINSTINFAEINTATFNNNIWERCIFETFQPIDTSIFANDFIRCKFVNSELLTAIYYTIFDKCSFYETEIDSYILGFQFGLSDKDLNKMKIEHFGEKNMPLSKSLRLMNNIYDNRRMFLEKELLNIIRNRQIGNAIESLIKLLIDYINNGWKIKVDEIRFIRRIINYLYKNNGLQLFYYYYIITHIENLSSAYCRNVLTENLYNELMLLCHTLYSIKMDIENEYRNLSSLLFDNEEYLSQMQIEFIYKNKPDYRISNIIEKSCYNKPYLPIYESYGSFHEIYEIAKEVINNWAAIITIVGGMFGVGKMIKSFFKRRRQKKINHKKQIAHNTVGLIEDTSCEFSELMVIEETTKTITETTIASLEQEKILHKTVETIVNNRIAIIRDYDKNNIKKIIVK